MRESRGRKGCSFRAETWKRKDVEEESGSEQGVHPVEELRLMASRGVWKGQPWLLSSREARASNYTRLLPLRGVVVSFNILH